MWEYAKLKLERKVADKAVAKSRLQTYYKITKQQITFIETKSTELYSEITMSSFLLLQNAKHAKTH